MLPVAASKVTLNPETALAPLGNIRMPLILGPPVCTCFEERSPCSNGNVSRDCCRDSHIADGITEAPFNSSFPQWLATSTVQYTQLACVHHGTSADRPRTRRTKGRKRPAAHGREQVSRRSISFVASDLEPLNFGDLIGQKPAFRRAQDFCNHGSKSRLCVQRGDQSVPGLLGQPLVTLEITQNRGIKLGMVIEDFPEPVVDLG